MKSKINATLLCASALTALNIVAPSQAFAQTAATTTAAAPAETAENAENAGDAGAIMVTARRRTESIVDVPLAISVVSAAKLEQLNITDTTQLANYVPGLQFSDYTPGYARNDRGATRPLIFRGLNVGTGGSVASAGGMFLDGAAVVGNEIPAGMDIGAVEVLRGPQSVYFGRSTMTGAVSYRTKDISKTKWEGEFEGKVGNYNTHSIQGTVAGPLVPDILGVRLTGLYEKSGGYTRNDYNGGELGNRSRRSVSGALDFTPTDTLEFKGYVNYFHDSDGAAATIFLPATNDNCRAPGAVQNTFCGLIPNRSHSINYFNTSIPDSSKFIFDNKLTNGAGFDDKSGLQRNAFNSHLIANWKIGDYLKLQSITGYHTNVTQQVADGITQPVTSTNPLIFPYSQYLYNIANRSRDFSQELRLSSDPERAFSWTVGTNYVNAYNKTLPLLAFYNQASTLTKSYQNLSTDKAKTYGFFGGAYLKLFDNKLTLSAEGRYQIDKRGSSQEVTNPAGVSQVVGGVSTLYGLGSSLIDLDATFRSFNPRFSVDYDLGGHRKIYASYATGTRPGGFNTGLYSYINRGIPTLTAQLNTYLPGAPVAYKEEKLKIAELGLKGNFAGGKGYFDLNAYYGQLENQQIGFGALIPYLGFSVVATDNIGKTKVYGLEWQGNYNFTNNLSLSTTFAWNHTDRTQFTYTSGLIQFGTTNLNGVEMANTPQFSGSAVAAYTHEIGNNWNAFTNVSYVYRGKQFVDPANLSYIHGRSQVDFRVGVENGRYTVEAFMTNVFNDRSYTAGAVAPDYGSGSSLAASGALYGNGFSGAVAPPRMIGGRFRLKI